MCCFILSACASLHCVLQDNPGEGELDIYRVGDGIFRFFSHSAAPNASSSVCMVVLLALHDFPVQSISVPCRTVTSACFRLASVIWFYTLIC